jgi:hypothetical protein
MASLVTFAIWLGFVIYLIWVGSRAPHQIGTKGQERWRVSSTSLVILVERLYLSVYNLLLVSRGT